MAMEGQRDTKNTALIPSVRTLADSKLGGDHYSGSASLELYRGSLIQIAAQSSSTFPSVAKTTRSRPLHHPASNFEKIKPGGADVCFSKPASAPCCQTCDATFRPLPSPGRGIDPDLLLWPEEPKKKMLKGTQVPPGRQLNFNDCGDSNEQVKHNVAEDAVEEDHLLELFFRSFLEPIVLNRIPATSVKNSRLHGDTSECLKTPIPLPLLTGVELVGIDCCLLLLMIWAFNWHSFPAS
ncbi:hypothetical protein B296_00045174 [Ensete ventricosum]|uniref:Uncharacterized protein n=1 Tax=Ensete ventricosum TaxID=4639 RepID=A0A426XUA6_ENSVE|nr:hypothetical protein B296_00045174 [Ensete ventricosum]